MFAETLQKLGLPKNEAKIYETLLDRGPLNVSAIASHAKIHRRNVYDSLSNLLNRRFVSVESRTKEQIYTAADPQRLKKLLLHKKQSITDILPELKKIYKEQQPTEQAYISRGTEGMKNFWRFVTSQQEPAYYIGGKGAWHDPAIDEERKKFSTDAAKKGVKIYGIFDHEMLTRGRDIISAYDPELTRVFPPTYSTKSSVDICADRILNFNVLRDRDISTSTIFTIVSRPLADSYRTWFQFLWSEAIPLKDAL